MHLLPRPGTIPGAMILTLKVGSLIGVIGHYGRPTYLHETHTLLGGDTSHIAAHGEQVSMDLLQVEGGTTDSSYD